MPRRKITGGSAAAANVPSNTGFAQYVGPAGVVKGLLKQLVITQTKPSAANPEGGEQFRFVVEVQEPQGSKLAVYNGQSAWGRQFLSHDSAGFVNGMLEGLGATKADLTAFWTDGPNCEKKDAKGAEKVLNIGKLKIDPKGMPVVVSMGERPAYTDDKGKTTPASMEPKSFLVPGAAAAPPPEVGDDDYSDPDVEEETAPAAAEEVEEEVEEETSTPDPFEVRTDELEALSKGEDGRAKLIRIAGKNGHGLRILTSDNNDQIIDKILDVEFPSESAAAEEPAVEEEEEAAPPPAKAPAKRGQRAAAAKVPPANDDEEPPF